MTTREDRIVERAEEIALKRTGIEFDNLPAGLQMDCFLQAEEDIRNIDIMAAEYYPRKEESIAN
jgi:hypothetical protein